VGAAAAVVVSPQFERAATGTAITSEGTAIEPSGDSKNSGATVDEVSFVHRATKENSCGDHTYISNPLRAFLTILLCA
jgi:hypothetical protein